MKKEDGMADFEKFRADGTEKIKLKDLETDCRDKSRSRSEYEAETAKKQKEIQEIQDRFYADGREGLILVLQAMDAAGKDGTVKHVMSGVNPQGVDVYSFKQPSKEDLAHDFLWRIGKCIPERGKIGIFNRSYYEDVLVVKVHEMNKTYHMAERIVGMPTKEFFDIRYEDIVNFEKYMYHNSYRVVKIFLNVSKKEQKKRFLERIDRPEKNWKFSSSDLSERALWDHYQEAYEDCINATSTKEAPWYVVPADDKWYTRYLVTEILLDALKKADPKYPTLTKEAIEDLGHCREVLEGEKTKEKKKKGKKS